MDYFYSKNLGKTSFDKTIEKVTENLKEKGFGVLTEIDVTGTFKKKLDVDFRNYRILGACNPDFAYKAISSEAQIGTMLPCNVVVQENENGEIILSAVNPVASMQAVENSELGKIAGEVKSMLEEVIDNTR